ncbi:MAG TPA: Gfo/Idh/MocA family oxidoreductase [Anaeromyxobacteraceae bacterium]|nr:Gfo/Idh/MocA family oxidoreductase [Anaeromyxobacteraceae bacterium]
MAQPRHRVGVIGTSWWADLEHLPGLRSREDVELAALCGRDRDRLAAMAEKHAVAATFTDWREMIARGGLEAVVIATPNLLHREQALAAIEAGLHVICEKPLAMTAAEAREMAARAGVKGRATLAFFTHRAVAAAAQVKRLVGEGFLGRPHHASAVYFSASHLKPDKPLAWRMRRAESGTGVLGDIGSHVVDLVRWWLGDFARVSGQWQTLTHERSGGTADADEDCSFLAQLQGGAQAVFQASKLVAGRGNYQRVELHGDRGSLVYEAEPGVDPTWEGRVWAGRPDKQGLELLPPPPDLAAGLDGPDPQQNRNQAYRRLTDPFFEAVRRGGRASPDFADGAAVQAVLDAVAESAERRTWVEIR